MINRFIHAYTMMKAAILFSLSLGTITLVTLPAFADQCAYISKEQALLVLSRLEVGQTLHYLCEPCGEKIPQSVTIKSLSGGTVGFQDYWQVEVNNSGIDLAYVFVDSALGNQPINLAGVAGCSASGVSTVLPTTRR